MEIMVQPPYTRRSFLKRVGITGAALGAGGTASAAASSNEDELDRFHVEGKRKTIVTYEPDVVTVEVRKVSPDLVQRLESGSRELVETTEYDREEFADDPWPERGRDVEIEDWETYIASEDEWQGVLETGGDNEIGAQHSHSSTEDRYDHAVWIYSNAEGSSYERRHPINVVFELDNRTHDDVQDVIIDDGWSYIAWDAIPPEEHRRFAWNQERESFEDSQASMAHAWTFGDPNIWGVNGRYHVQSWEFVDGLVGMHCHEDTPVPHSVASYTTAESEIRDLFASTSGWDVTANATALSNANDDHNGLATRIED